MRDPERVETRRLVLQRFRAADAEAFAELCACPEVTRFAWGRPLAESESLALLRRWVRHWETQGFGPWAARERVSGRLAGSIGLAVPHFLPEVLPAVEVGWRLHPDWWGQGLALEGAAAALELAFDHLGLESVVSITQPGNVRSRALMERLGLRPARRVMHPARRLPLVVYQLSGQEWTAGLPKPAPSP